MSTNEIDRLGTEAAEMAMVAAASVVRSSVSDLTGFDFEGFTNGLREALQPAVRVALDDAREAYEAGMAGFVVPTFRATITSAAAKYAREYVDAR